MHHPLDDRILTFMSRGEGAFEDLALDLFAYQYERNPAYRGYCDRRGARPGTLASWEEIPPVPALAFKQLDLACQPLAEAEAVFESSGTTRGTGARGRHFMFNLALYRASVLTHFRPYLLPDRDRIACRVLLPSGREAPHSSLSRMMDYVVDAFGAPGSGFYVTGGTLQLDRLIEDLRAAHEPQCLLGASFSFVHFLDACQVGGVAFRLPEGSRLMDTGGYKGRSREVPRGELLARYREVLGLDEAFCVNEYGMAEMTSQFYEPCLRDRLEGRPPRRLKQPPAWVRSQALDPVSLRPVPLGEVGLLKHVDLGNRGSAMAILTEDLGRVTEEGIELIGRARGAEAKGCSIAADELLSQEP